MFEQVGRKVYEYSGVALSVVFFIFDRHDPLRRPVFRLRLALGFRVRVEAIKVELMPFATHVRIVIVNMCREVWRL